MLGGNQPTLEYLSYFKDIG